MLLKKQYEYNGAIMPFKKGKSGNVKGRPPGALNMTTRAAQALLAGEAETLTRACIELAKAGNIAALKICMERIIPAKKGMPIDLPGFDDAADAHKLTGALLAAVANGELAASDAATIAGLSDEHIKAINRRDNANFQKNAGWSDMFKW
jgi:hypothetical protein